MLADGGTASASAPALDGSVALSFKVRREGQQLIAEAEGATKPWVVLLRGITDAVVEGGVAEVGRLGTRTRLQPAPVCGKVSFVEKAPLTHGGCFAILLRNPRSRSC